MKQNYFLNHMAAPGLVADDILLLCKDLELSGVELRNDIGDGDPFNGETPENIRQLSASLNVKILTINALQQCNRSENRGELLQSLQKIAEIARAAGIEAIVMCPVNDHDDPRSQEEALRDLETNLRAFAPVLIDAGLTGFVEPLGFPQSSLRSQAAALRAIESSGETCYKLLLDTFHFALGPDTFSDLEQYPTEMIGLIHVSGVNEAIPRTEMTDDHRLLLGPGDTLETVRQLQAIVERGYRGPIAFEPFSPLYRSMDRAQVAREVRRSVQYVQESLAQ